MKNYLINLSSVQEAKITTQTRKGNDIENNQLPLIELSDLWQAESFKKRYCSAQFRTSPCNFYNCHGLTFASRRTRVYNPNEIQKILHEDNCSEISKISLMEGDIIIYYKDGDSHHSGIVLKVEKLGSSIIPIILSKWGSLQEVIHRENYCPYYEGSTIKYYRIKGTSEEI